MIDNIKLLKAFSIWPEEKKPVFKFENGWLIDESSICAYGQTPQEALLHYVNQSKIIFDRTFGNGFIWNEVIEILEN